MNAKLGLIALACVALASTSSPASAAPKKSSKKLPTKKHHPTKSKPPVSSGGNKAGGSGQNGPAIEQGDTRWVTGTIASMELSAAGILTKLELDAGSTTSALNMASSCSSSRRIVIAQHPELVNAFDRGHTVSVLLQGVSLSPRRYCVEKLSVKK